MEVMAILATLRIQYVFLTWFAAGLIATIAILSLIKDALMTLLNTTTASVSKLAKRLREALRYSQTSQ